MYPYLLIFALGMAPITPRALVQEGTATPASEVKPAGEAAPSELNDRFLDPELDASQWVERWEAESREIYAARASIVRAVDPTPGMRIADIGAGTGLFVEPFAAAVSDRGMVYARDIAPAFVDHIRKRMAKQGVKQVEARVSKTDDAVLPGASVDVVFLCDTYHHFDQPKKMLDSIHDALRQGGHLVVVDFERIPGQSREWILGHVRAGKKQVIREIESAGFALEREVKIEGLKENYFLRFRKQPTGDRP